MINGVGPTGSTRIGQTKLETDKVSAVSSTGSVEKVETENTQPSTLVAALAEAGPPIDSDKIAAIQAAIAQGRYPLDVKAIAQRMLALDLPAKSA